MPDEQREPTQARGDEICPCCQQPVTSNASAESVLTFMARQPASPSEQTPTRVELRAAYEAGFEASGEGWNGEYLGPKVEYPACLDKGFAEWLSEQPASAPSEQREGEARGDLATDLIGAADYLRDHGMAPRYEARCREAASTLDHQTKALEAADELAQAVREQIEDEPERLSTASTVAFEVYQATRDRTTKGGRNDMAEERMRDDTCPTCGGPVVVQGDGLTHWYRPAPTDQGERDGLAERLEARADEEEGLRPANPTNLRAADTLRVGRAEAFREAAQMARDESSTEGGARPGDTPLNDTRTNGHRPWREDVARAFVTNRPAQPEGAGEAREETPLERAQHAIYDALRTGEPVGPTMRAILQGQLPDKLRAALTEEEGA